MNTDDLDSESTRSRKPIILIGAPSGAGKTVLSKEISAGAFPLISNLCGWAPNGTPACYDLKTLPENLPKNQILIIECATHRFDKLTRTDPWRRLTTLIREAELIVHVNFNVPKFTVVRQYFLRIFTEPKQLNVFYRALRVSKYRNTLVYLLSRQIQRANTAWQQFGTELARRMPTRVALTHVQRTGTNYEIRVEKLPTPSPPATATANNTYTSLLNSSWLNQPSG